MLALAGTLVYAALQNDAFTDLTPPLDDTGFTHDNVLAIGVTRGDYVLGGKIFDRFITSKRDRRRWDQVDLLATVERALAVPSPFSLVASGRAGPTFGGNFGGRYVQNGWHSFSGTGPTIDEGLANDYPGDRRIGVLAGGRVHGELPSRPDDAATRWQLRAIGYANVDGQLTAAAGVSAVDADVGGWVGAHHVGVHGELAVTRYHVADPNLSLPGGYGTGWQFEWRAGIDVSWSRYRLAYEYRANEGGSGEPIGVVAFSLH